MRTQLEAVSRGWITVDSGYSPPPSFSCDSRLLLKFADGFSILKEGGVEIIDTPQDYSSESVVYLDLLPGSR